jgi:hypothetical protein
MPLESRSSASDAAGLGRADFGRMVVSLLRGF